MRVGLGVDVHRWAEQPSKPLRLAGLDWPEHRPLAGHSDGDVAVHAMVDALASAAGLGDIGTIFGTDLPAHAGANSLDFLRQTSLLVTQAGWRISHIALTVIGNQPRLSQRREAAQALLSQTAGSPVSITATTTDGLGLTGRGEGVAAMATALLLRLP
ncbi:MAG: 2-C-methyl-D-erythritol 2,4-cyclodiphosphate synthase [Bifidobacteriaceae bacterium]|nr:2-C-methyl-D-erythritol 2,4-cyclodiphosphate synthase [Bifidobacteriaceae bacterium]